MFGRIGKDSDSGIGWLLLIIFGLLIIATVIALFLYAGAFIGGFMGIKNYVMSFKHNVIDPKPNEA